MFVFYLALIFYIGGFVCFTIFHFLPQQPRSFQTLLTEDAEICQEQSKRRRVAPSRHFICKHHLTCCYLTEKIQLTFSLFMDLIFKFRLVVSQKLIGLFEVWWSISLQVFIWDFLFLSFGGMLFSVLFPFVMIMKHIFFQFRTKHRHWNVVRCFPILF